LAVWVIGVVGAFIGGFILDNFLLDITIKILLLPCVMIQVLILLQHLLVVMLLFYIMNKLNHNKEGKRY
jgi:uncharacterized membrane protein YeaQ/YmgE (transglycosylase-associated protein family)